MNGTKPHHHWKAVASPVLAILSGLFWVRFMFPSMCEPSFPTRWALFSLLAAIAGVYIGHRARKDIREQPDRLKGGWAALAGLILAYPMLLGYVTGFLTPLINRSPQAFNESTAVHNLRQIVNAEETYGSTRDGRYANLAELIAARALDSRFGSPVQCYKFNVTASGEKYEARALPISPDAGRFGYYGAPDGVIRYSTIMSLAPTEHSGKPVE